MFHGIRAICAVTLLLLIQACTFEVKESALVNRDEEPTVLQENQLEEIRGLRDSLDVVPIRVNRSDGALARGLWLRQPGSEKVLVYFGGNTMRIARNFRILEHLLAIGTDVVWLDHRGLGASTGNPDLAKLKRDGLETFDYVADRTDKPIVLHGMSLGSFIAGHVATHRPGAALVLEASATTAEDWAHAVTPWYARPFVRLDIDPDLVGEGSEPVVREYTGPLFILVGEEDETTPVRLSRDLYEMSSSRHKQLHVADGRNHGAALSEAAAKRELRRFVQAL